MSQAVYRVRLGIVSPPGLILQRSDVTVDVNFPMGKMEKVSLSIDAKQTGRVVLIFEHNDGEYIGHADLLSESDKVIDVVEGTTVDVSAISISFM